MFEVEMRGDKELIARMYGWPPKVRDSLWREINLLRILLLQRVQSKLRGEVLNYVTGRLFRSIQSEATDTGTEMTGRVFSSGDVKYAAIHEYGGVIPAHEVAARNALALHFDWGGQERFFKRVQIPDINMPERSFLRSSLDEMRQDIIEGMRKAVLDGFGK